ncbi:LIC_11366 family protein [Leptospira idonii]|uniref:Porin n=1 Tax=Leptospira idonii TaxID=1193500 RepID=A0A4R9M2W8_9LEPT|nr:hypothetical protein [Leptospira idonii]TGN21134.1 hypothetical protein EHS15_01040 [Leptospira idonii]
MSRCIGLFCTALLLSSPFLGISAEGWYWEAGLRTGVGQRVPGRFDSNLNSFSSSFNPIVFSEVRQTGGRETATYEGFVRFMISPHSKVGMVLGRQDLAKLNLTEATSDLYQTRLTSEIYSYHFLGTYHYVIDLSRRWEWENGVGMGFTSADWDISGWSVGGEPNVSVFQQKGKLRGSGLAFRAETAINRRLGDSNFLQLGIAYHHIAIARFNGSYNGEESSFYIRQDGKVGIFDDTRVIDANISTSQYMRRLDLNSGSWSLYFSVIHRFLD